MVPRTRAPKLLLTIGQALFASHFLKIQSRHSSAHSKRPHGGSRSGVGRRRPTSPTSKVTGFCMGRERSVGYADVKQALSNSTGSPRYHRFTPPAVRPTYKWTRGVRLKGRSSDAGWLGFVVGLSSYDPRAGACPSAHSESPIWVMSKIRPSGPRGAGPRLLTNPYKSVNIVLATIDGVGRAPWFPSRPCSAGPIALKIPAFEYSVAALEGSVGAPLAEQQPRGPRA